MLQVADDEPSTEAAHPAADTDRFYLKGVEFASMGGASLHREDDDYDEEDETAPAPGPTLSVREAKESPLINIPSQLDAKTPPTTSDLASAELGTSGSEQESLDSGIGSQTSATQDLSSPQSSLIDVKLPDSGASMETTSEPQPAITGVPEVSEDSQEQELPDNMSLDELHAKVKKLFPGFKPNSILRFSSLLGPGKPSSLPKLWSEAKKPPKRKPKSEPVEWKLDCDFIPPEHMINTDDEVRRQPLCHVIKVHAPSCPFG